MRAAAVQLKLRRRRIGTSRRRSGSRARPRPTAPSWSCFPSGSTSAAARRDYLAGAEPLDGRPVSWARELARELGDRPRRRLDRRAPRGTRARVEHLGPRGPRRRDPGRLPQDPHVRRGGRRRGVPRVRALRAGRRDRALRDRRTASALGLTICYDLRFPELYRILALRGARIDHGARQLHARHRRGALGGAAARPRDREPGVRDRARPGPRDPGPRATATATR